VSSIQRRLLDQWGPSYEVLQRSLYAAQDHFELKVEILTFWSELDPNGWSAGHGPWITPAQRRGNHL
jgi:hypothetical protein